MTRLWYLQVETVKGEIVAVHGTPKIGTLKDLAKEKSTFDKVFDTIARLLGVEGERPTFFPAPSTKFLDYLNERGRKGWELVELRPGEGEDAVVYILKRETEYKSIMTDQIMTILDQGAALDVADPQAAALTIGQAVCWVATAWAFADYRCHKSFNQSTGYVTALGS